MDLVITEAHPNISAHLIVGHFPNVKLFSRPGELDLKGGSCEVH